MTEEYQFRELLKETHRDYKKSSLDINNICHDPIEQFAKWFDDAVKAGFPDPNAMCLSTASKEGKPSSRMLLLKDFDKNGFVFYTNYTSRKALEIEENPFGALLFFWDVLERQVRIEGRIEKISAEESDKYFQTRPYTSKIGAWASKQSSELPSRFTLLREVAKLMLKYPIKVPLPPFWGGYRLIPDLFEFWQGRPNRLHDRFQFKLIENNWEIKRLYP